MYSDYKTSNLIVLLVTTWEHSHGDKQGSFLIELDFFLSRPAKNHLRRQGFSCIAAGPRTRQNHLHSPSANLVHKSSF